MALKEEKLELEGEVIEALRNRMFRIQLDNGHETLGYAAGRMRRRPAPGPASRRTAPGPRRPRSVPLPTEQIHATP